MLTETGKTEFLKVITTEKDQMREAYIFFSFLFSSNKFFKEVNLVK